MTNGNQKTLLALTLKVKLYKLIRTTIHNKIVNAFVFEEEKVERLVENRPKFEEHRIVGTAELSINR
jgi:hypothetical protein